MYGKKIGSFAMSTEEFIIQRIKESMAVKERITNNANLITTIASIAEEIAECIKTGHKVVLCGNGGSASDALHFAGEIVGRFQKERLAWPAVVLNSDVATMTAIANDYGYNEMFSRQAEGHVQHGDFFIGISTSGNSENVRRAIDVAKRKGAKTAALLGNSGGIIKDTVDYPVVVECDITARVQESHICIIHILCELVEEKLTD